MAALYIPPVQQLIRQQATGYASKATGMDIRIERVDLRFPLNLLVRGVEIIQPCDTARASDALSLPDTLLAFHSLNIRIQALPLFKGRVEVDDITLKQARINSARLLEGMQVRADMGHLALHSHGIDLRQHDILLNLVDAADVNLQVELTDTISTPKDTTAAQPFPWRIRLPKLSVSKLSADIAMPLAQTHLTTRVNNVTLTDVLADLTDTTPLFGCGGVTFDVPDVTYSVGQAAPQKGFDASHIGLRNLRLALDSLLWNGNRLQGIIREGSLHERSGLSVESFTGRLNADSNYISIPDLQLRTAHSLLQLTVHTLRNQSGMSADDVMNLNFDARLGKPDVLLFAGKLSPRFLAAYPSAPLSLHAAAEGNATGMRFKGWSASLPGAFSMQAEGTMQHPSDTLRRKGTMTMRLLTGDMKFMKALLTDSVGQATFAIPDSLSLEADFNLVRNRCEAALRLREAVGEVSFHGNYHIDRQAYDAQLKVDRFNVHHFLPGDSLYKVTFNAAAQGRGFDLNSAQLMSHLYARLELLQYGRNDFADITLLGDVHRDSVKVSVEAGDLELRFRARGTIEELLGRTTRFGTVLTRQIKDRYLDHAEMRRTLPSAYMFLRSGNKNPLSKYLQTTQGIRYNRLALGFGFSSRRGINGRTAIHGLHVDSLQIDSVYFAVRQDTARMTLQGGVVNAPGNPQYVFHSVLTGEIRNNDADLLVNFVDGNGDTGLNLGVNIKPMVAGGRRGRANGLVFRLIPENPVVAFRPFRFVDDHNWVYLHENMRVYANVEMADDKDMAFVMRSVRGDSVSLQNMEVELQRFPLREISRILPYMPRLGGLLSAEVHYIQSEGSLQLSAEAQVNNFSYERRPVGNIGVGATWLPGEDDTHYLNAYVTAEDEQVITADARLKQYRGRDSVAITTTFEHFPLRLANALVPDRMVELGGDIDGEISITGTDRKPKMLGQLALDSVTVYARQAGARYRFDNRPVRIEDEQVHFDQFAIYTTGTNPFIINGNLSFRDPNKPTADLRLTAQNYTLLDAPRTHESLIYGKILVDLRATVKGALDALTMRGTMNVLSATDVTYVLENSPLTVQDRLGDLVTFTSFTDTLTAREAGEVPQLSLGGMNMVMSLNIAETAKLKADLSADRSSRIELEGGGTLNLQYTPQGTLNLTGRYTLADGMMKYQLPVIPLKEFQLVSGSYVDWTGDIMNPTLNLTATERVRASVGDTDGSGSRPVNFDVSVGIKNHLTAPELSFDLEAPEDATIQNELATMGSAERNKQAVAMLATGLYLKSGAKGGTLDMGSALNSVLTTQINSLVGNNMKNASINVGVQEGSNAETGGKTTDYSFRYSQRFFNDRVQVIIGGKVSTGSNATNDVESFIDNVSVEYRLDDSATRYVRAFHNKNYESVLDGEITETGVGLVLRRKVNRLGELFIFKKKK
jgi:hypothetical protein